MRFEKLNGMRSKSGYRTRRGDNCGAVGVVSTVSEQETANGVRMAALITKQLRRHQAAGGRALRRRKTGRSGALHVHTSSPFEV